MNVLASLEKQSRGFWIVAGFALIAGVGLIDFLTGYEFAFSLLYLLPISLLTWLTGRRLGIVASLVCAFVRLFSHMAAENSYGEHVIYVWNALIRLSFFVIVALLLSALRRALDHERELSKLDAMTGAMNSRFFFEVVQMELHRTQRYKRPFTIAYLDIDNFKTVNDRFGHTTGDQVLRTVVIEAKKRLRRTDVIARLGGDEFAVLLPETDQEAAHVVLAKLQSDIVEGMQQRQWPVTLSIGVLTCLDAPHATDDVVRLVDDVMYSAKRSSKNGIKYATYAGSPARPADTAPPRA